MPSPTRTDLDLDYLDSIDWWSNVDTSDPRGCWPWRQSTGSHGYGQTWDRVTVRLAHRVAWALHHRQQIPEGQTVDHECGNRICCNPFHLRLMSNTENAAANGPALRTHCPRGHEYSVSNTYVNAKGHRFCRACRSRWNKPKQQGASVVEILMLVLLAAVVLVGAIAVLSDPNTENPDDESWQIEDHTLDDRRFDCLVVRNGKRQDITAIDCEETTDG